MPKTKIKTSNNREAFSVRTKWDGECLLWFGANNGEGYGVMKDHRTGKRIQAHRLAYELVIGPIPEGMFIDHTCHKRNCVNAHHLRPTTNKQNVENHKGLRSDNTSGIRGVCWVKARKRWWASVKHNGKLYSAGYFTEKEEAAAAVIAKRLELFTHNDADR